MQLFSVNNNNNETSKRYILILFLCIWTLVFIPVQLKYLPIFIRFNKSCFDGQSSYSIIPCLFMNIITIQQRHEAKDRSTSHDLSGNDITSMNNSGNNNCQAENFHIAQRTNVNNTDDTVSMTLSLSYNYSLECSYVKPMILYGMIENENENEDIRNSNNNHYDVAIGTNPIQYNYSSNETMSPNEVYQSDYIYHIELTNVKAGLKQYWYRVLSFQQQYYTQEQNDRNVVDEHNTEYQVLNESTTIRLMKELVNDASISNKLSWKLWREQHLFLNSQNDVSSTARRKGDTTNRLLSNRMLLITNVIESIDDSYNFITPPLPGQQQPTTLVFVGDFGQSDASARTVKHILQYQLEQTLSSSNYGNKGLNPNNQNIANIPSGPISNLIIVGDMSYANSNPYLWKTWLKFMEPLIQSISLTVIPGNHEIECNTNTNDIFVAYENLFYNPNRIQPAQMKPIIPSQYKSTSILHRHVSCSHPSEMQGVYNYGNAFYSYIHGLAHIIVLNPYTATNITSVKYQWLLNELKNNVNRTLTPWLIVTFHTPFYTTFLGHLNEYQVLDMKHSIEPLLNQYHVNIIVSGHDHAYMRTKSILYNNRHPFTKPTIDPENGIIYFIIGTGGNSDGGHSSLYIHPFFPETFVAKRSVLDYGYGLFQLYNTSHAYYQWMKDDNVNPNFQDSIWIINCYG